MEYMTPFLSEYTPYLIIEQISYLRKKSFLPGPKLVLPFIGNAISLVRNPTKFWDHQSFLAKSNSLSVSANYILGRFIVYLYCTELSRKVLTNVRADGFHPIAHPCGKKLLGEHNLFYMFGQEHKDLRRSIAPDFAPKGLAFYTSKQQRIILKHLQSWLQKSEGKPIPLRMLCCDMNLETSQTVFVGCYLDDGARNRFNIDYNLYNLGWMSLPIDLPGFAFKNARLAHKKLVESLAICSRESEKKMLNGDDPTCMIDFWILELLRESIGRVFTYRHEELGAHLFDFLFAAQDASTSSLLWAVTLLESHLDVLQGVRSSVAKHWDPELDLPIMAEQLREMKFTKAVAKEVVKIRAPATVVPHIAGEDFALTEKYVIPKGSTVFPSVFDSCFQGFPDPYRFDPMSFMEEREEDSVYKWNFLAFGTPVCGTEICY